MVSNTKNLKRFYDVAPAGACATEHGCELHDTTLVVGEGQAPPPYRGNCVVVHVFVFVPPPHVALHGALDHDPLQCSGGGGGLEEGGVGLEGVVDELVEADSGSESSSLWSLKSL
jgi:hypothetical protein